MIAPLPLDEKDRLEALFRYDILDTPPEQSFDDLTLLASHICDTPTSVISFVDETRQWFKSKVGMAESETSRDVSFCAHGILHPNGFVVEDAQADERFAANPMGTGMAKFRFYAGAPLTTSDGHTVGMLCVYDQKPRKLSPNQMEALGALGRQVITQLELRHSLKAMIEGEKHLRASELSYRRLFEAAKDGILILDAETGRITDGNPFLVKLLGFSQAEMIGKTVGELSPFKDIESNKAMLEQLQANGYVRYENLPLETRDGRHVDVEFVSNVYKAGDKSVIQCNIRDVTERKEGQRALLESEEKFRQMAESITDVFWITSADLETKYYISPGYQRIWGRSPESLYSDPHQARNAILPIDRQRAFDAFAALKADEREISVEYQITRPDGVVRWIHDRGFQVRDAAGQLTRLTGIATDITDRKRAEIAYLRMAAIVQFSDDAIMGYDLDGIITSWNRGAENIFGYTASEMVGTSLMRLIPGGRQVEENQILGKIKKGESVLHYESVRQTKEGRRIDVSITASPIKDDVGKSIGVSKVARDITEQKRAEAQIAEQAALLDKARDAILVRDLDGKNLFWNKGAERMYGWTREEAIGQNSGRLFYTDPKKFTELNGLTISQGQWQGELEHLTKNRGKITVEARWTLILDEEGQPKSVLAINTDITERKRIETQFLRAQRMESIGTLASGIAHDLNNILSPILLSIHVLKNESDNPRTDEILETIEVSARRGADIVRQVLWFARGLEGERIEVQLRHLARDLQSIIKDTFSKDIRLVFLLPNDTWTVLGDPTQIQQILLNLCVNARDAMPNGGKLTIKIENCELDEQFVSMNPESKAGPFVKISVSDTGMGIPKGIQDKIFEPFFTTKDLNKGSGLGLSTVMAIVKSHAGIINVYSEPGRGATFNIYLPALKVSSEVERKKTQSVSVPPGKGETVLVVDDEAAIVTITSRTLKALGYQVLTATDGADALGVYLQNRNEVAIVLTDMVMPVMDGPALIHALKRINPGIKIIGASGLGANGNVSKADGEGVKHFLTKPFTAEELSKTMRAILDET